jgi:hypothetical protein
VAGFASISADVFRGLAFLHSQKQLHRDIKPANILRVAGGGACKLADFGISKQLEDTMEMAQTWVGTLQYMSPERIGESAGGYSYPADVWSMGLSLLAVAAGKFPFGSGANSYFAMLDKVQDVKAPLLCLEEQEKHGKFIDPGFRDLMERCLTQDPAKRITASEALHHPFVLKAWRPSLLSSRVRPPWYDRRKPSDEEEKKIQNMVSKAFKQLLLTSLPVFTRFHAKGKDAAETAKRRMAMRLDDTTFNRHKAERLLVSAGATGDFSYLLADSRTMGFLSQVAHASALRTSLGGGEAPSVKRSSSTRASRDVGAASLGATPKALPLRPVRFDEHASDPVTEKGKKLLLKALTGQVEDVGSDDAITAMASALRAGAARVKDAWGESSAAEHLEVSASGETFPMGEYGVGPSSSSEEIVRNVPEWALRLEPDDVFTLAEQTCLKPSSISERFNHLLSRYCSKQRERLARKEAERKASEPEKPAVVRRSGSDKGPPVKALPKPGTTPGGSSSVQVIQVAGGETAIPVYTR